MDLRVIGNWIVDFKAEIAYSKFQNGWYARRADDGAIVFISSPPEYIQRFVSESGILGDDGELKMDHFSF